MKLWALIIAAGSILAFAAPGAVAASPAGTGGSARPVNTVTAAGPQTTVVFRDVLPGPQPFLHPLDRPASRATVALLGNPKVTAVLAPKPAFWELLASARFGTLAWPTR
jgi:hypothetical protein